MKKIVVVALFVALVGGLFVAVLTQSSKAESPSAVDAPASAMENADPAASTEEGDAEVLDAVSLQAMDIEEIKRRHGAEPVAVRGVAKYVGPDLFGLPAVELSNAPDGPTLVLCVLPYGDFKKLENIRKGETVTFSGDPRGKTQEGVVVMKQCVLAVPPVAPAPATPEG